MPREYLTSANDSYGAHALRSNVAQLSVQVKANRIVCSGDDPSDLHWRETDLDKKIEKIDRLLEDGRITEAIDEAESAILLSKESLSFYRRYQRNRFIFYLTVAWLGWIALLMMKLMSSETLSISRNYEASRTYKLRVANIVFLVAVIIVLIEDKRKCILFFY